MYHAGHALHTGHKNLQFSKNVCFITGQPSLKPDLIIYCIKGHILCADHAANAINNISPAEFTGCSCHLDHFHAGCARQIICNIIYTKVMKCILFL